MSASDAPAAPAAPAPHYLSTRANWEAAANATGASLEEAVRDTLRAYLDATYPGEFRVDSHPGDFKQLYLEEDYRRNPEIYSKPPIPVAGDIWYEPDNGLFMIQGARSATVAQMGCIPDVKISNLASGNTYYIECKAQNDAGNAHERACKFATPSFLDAMKRKMDVDYHPIGYLFSGDLINKKKYILELRLSFGFAADHMMLWQKTRPAADLARWFERTIKNLLV